MSGNSDKDTGSVIAESEHFRNGNFCGTFNFKGEVDKPGEIIFRGPYTSEGIIMHRNIMLKHLQKTASIVQVILQQSTSPVVVL